MAWPVYSERLIATEKPNAWMVVAIPEGYRAVIKCVTATNATATAARVNVVIHGIYLLDGAIPAYTSIVHGAMHVVLYERETIQVYQYAATGGIVVSGFLFHDDGGRLMPPAEPLTKPGPARVES